MINLERDKLMTSKKDPIEQIELSKTMESSIFTRITTRDLRERTKKEQQDIKD
jgi:hypothetical protein